MNRHILFFILISLMILFFACQEKNQVEELAKLPIAITNNAVCGVVVDGREYVYSFGGLGAGKTHKDITLRSFKLDVRANQWTEIEALPDTMPKIAAAASVVKDKIYIVGGYHVFPDGHEKSSSKVHVYDPLIDQYLENASDIPTPIDDQVQAVWQDSLIYVISGWSDSLNVGMVQVFSPDTKHWQYGTSLPNEYSFHVFGGSGLIMGNKIFYAGGAGNRQNSNFPIQSFLRVGEINEKNPLDIHWSFYKEENARIYRSGVMIIEGKPAWVGGANISYNYNGIAYTKEPVEPLTQALILDKKTNHLYKSQKNVPTIMDMRGIAQFESFAVIVGGIGKNQVVSDRVFLLSYKLE